MDMFQLTVPWWELMIRAAVVYLALILLIRLSGRRQIGELSPFDLILLLILSESVQNAMSAGENSLTGGLILAGTLLFVNYLIGVITFRSKKAENLIEGQPQILIRNGKVFQKVMERARITEDELMSSLRESGFFNIEDVRTAILEDNGTVSVEGYEKPERSRPRGKK